MVLQLCWRRRSIERNPALLLGQRGWGCYGDLVGQFSLPLSIRLCLCIFIILCLYTKGILYAKICTRLNHLGAKIEKSPYHGRGANPLPHPLPPLGRYAPSQSRNLFRNFLFQMLGGLKIVCGSFQGGPNGPGGG